MKVDTAVSLYVHIPFCKRKCDYCDFFSQPFSSVPDAYISAVLAELSWQVREYSVSSWKTVYIGGGTPSLLSTTQLSTLVGGILSVCGRGAAFPEEITIEMNPDDVTVPLLSAAAACGINRISMGIQTLDDTVLSLVHRRCTRETSLAALACIERMWGGRFSADMISGLPMHTDRAFLGELAELVSFHPDHVSLYSLVVEKHTPLGRALERGILPYDTDAADGQWLAGRDFLERNGYGQYEVSNFAHPGAESIHNQAYWRLENYIGVGAGATGSVYGESGNAGMRWTNFNDIEVYTAFWNEKHQGKELPRSVEVLDQSTEEFEFLMMGFRMLCGISSRTYTSRFGGILGQRIGAYDGGLFSKWQQQGLAVLKENGTDVRFALTREGVLFLNSFLESL